jgi:hypothetical protein
MTYSFILRLATLRLLEVYKQHAVFYYHRNCMKRRAEKYSGPISYVRE